MQYIVIEKQGGWGCATIVTDEEGKNLTFDSLEEAQIESDNCQDGIIVGDGVETEADKKIDEFSTSLGVGRAVIEIVKYFKSL